MFEIFFLCSLLVVGFSQFLPAGPESSGGSDRPLETPESPERPKGSRHRSHPRADDVGRVTVHRHPGSKPNSTGNFGIRLSLRLNLHRCLHRFGAQRSSATSAPESTRRLASPPVPPPSVHKTAGGFGVKNRDPLCKPQAI